MQINLRRAVRNLTLTAVLVMPFAAAAHASPGAPKPDPTQSSPLLDAIAKFLGL